MNANEANRPASSRTTDVIQARMMKSNYQLSSSESQESAKVSRGRSDTESERTSIIPHHPWFEVSLRFTMNPWLPRFVPMRVT